MRIGSDFEKIEFNFCGFDLLEPNSLIGNTILFISALIISRKVQKLSIETSFFNFWRVFFIAFGCSFFIGGLGHGFYNYWGVVGKYPGWIASIISLYFMERAMLSLLEHPRLSVFVFLSKIKLLIFLVLELTIFTFLDLKGNPQLGLLIPSIASAFGFLTCLGYLGWRYTHEINSSFRYFYWSIMVLIPSAVLQGMKISIAPWLDRSDLSHLLLLVVILLHWNGVRGYAKSSLIQ
ncbi:MAG: hypothetical protein P8H94_03770 [Crocinitomicaceae bacterium]|nr:hypothetical protein [Crocinitomicaceae bacterium]